MTSRTHSIRSTSKQSSGSSQLKTKQSLTSSTSKSNPVKAFSSQSIIKSTSSKTRSENVKLSDDSTVKKRKSREQAGYSEKRGTSTIYMPKSTTSKLNTKSNEKTVHRTSRDKEKLQDSSTLDRTKPRMPSRERRKSRTLSPSEIKMLHNAIKRPSVEKIEQKKNDIRSDVQTNSDEETYDYEDDFEVRKYKKNRELASNNLAKRI